MPQQSQSTDALSLVNDVRIRDGIDTSCQSRGHITVDDGCMQLSRPIGEWHMRSETRLHALNAPGHILSKN